MPREALISCFLRSMSTSTVLYPAVAIDIARFSDIVVLPSPAIVLVTMIIPLCPLFIWRRSFVRRPCMDSENPLLEPLLSMLGEQFSRERRLTGTVGTAAYIGRLV